MNPCLRRETWGTRILAVLLLLRGLGQDFGEVFRAGGCVLGDLFAAAEAVADDDGFGIGADGGQEDSFA